jgi:osmotically inducible protein OsmC
MVRQTAGVLWEGSIARGEGRLHGESGAIDGLDVDLPNRMGERHDKTSPEELIAAAHATCFTMALGSILARERTPPERLKCEAVCLLDETEGARRIVSIELDVRGRVPGADSELFERAASQAEQLCVVSKALKGNVDISSRATLEPRPAA